MLSKPIHEELFQDAFHFAAIGMALVGLDGRWLRVNRSVCQMLGYTEAELLARSFQEITHPDDLDLDLAYVGQLLRGEITAYQMEKRYFHQEGRTIWALLDVALVRDEQDRPEVFLSQISDITARKTAEQELARTLSENQRLVAELQETNKLIEEMRAQLLRVCSWTKRIFFDGRWISMDTFLSQHLRLRLTHGISEEAFTEVMSEIDKNLSPPKAP